MSKNEIKEIKGHMMKVRVGFKKGLQYANMLSKYN